MNNIENRFKLKGEDPILGPKSKFLLTALLITLGTVNVANLGATAKALGDGYSKQKIEKDIQELREVSEVGYFILCELGRPGRELVYTLAGENSK